MKKKFQKCESCQDITTHSIKKVISVQKGLRRDIDKCDNCGKIIIKNRKKGVYTISGKNE